ncbi:hypothetical protein PR202_gb27731 [Eleusine coracana subsp. coracana]|uniref:non-specific serine/threonine protein kinase n=1 Tax=Eleusine coracana subsp. coracana TaxID=191504 RepID=A0AAV5FUL7_ELECO|nr:hypothetical protein PR202_gb27731 [Eleusine coracana subsp. coracana]
MDDEYNIHDDLERILRDPKAEPCDIPLQYLRDITNNFSDDQKLGEGGFGVVYKGELPNGIMVAVKYLRSVSQCQEKQFKNEIDSLMTVKHKNIVQFVGYCYETQQKYTKFNGRNVFAETAKRLLCFEFMPNGSLDQYISEETCGLDWHKRYKIIKDICCGLHYLHNECQTNSSLIHLDIKPDNVLLGENMVAKIADFGLAKLFDNKKSQTFATSLVGSQGYMAPEYIFEGIISPMADIYSLGVIIIQIITGHSFGPSGIETFSGDFVEPVRNCVSTIKISLLLQIISQLLVHIIWLSNQSISGT